MRIIINTVWSFIATMFRSRASLQAEILALRQQLAAYHRAGHRPRFTIADRLFWAWLSRIWSGWKDALIFVQPETVLKWQKKRFREYWFKLSRLGHPGRPTVSQEVRELIRRMWTWPGVLHDLEAAGSIAED